jgi:flagellar M-ring protein FliF
VKAKYLLEQFVGAGQVIVQVNADLDFERVERSVESYDPSSTVIRSEQRTTESAAGGSPKTILTNYEIDHTIEKILGSVGTIRRLSVAVLVNGSFETGPGGDVEYVERTPRELATLSAIVRDAVGWDDSRGDSLELANLRFAEPPAPESVTKHWSEWLSEPSVAPITRALVIVAVVGLLVWGIRRSATVIANALETDHRRRDGGLSHGRRSESDPKFRPAVIREEMHNLARDRPSEVAQVLRSWLVEEKSP